MSASTRTASCGPKTNVDVTGSHARGSPIRGGGALNGFSGATNTSNLSGARPIDMRTPLCRFSADTPARPLHRAQHLGIAEVVRHHDARLIVRRSYSERLGTLAVIHATI